MAVSVLKNRDAPFPSRDGVEPKPATPFRVATKVEADAEKVMRCFVAVLFW